MTALARFSADLRKTSGVPPGVLWYFSQVPSISIQRLPTVPTTPLLMKFGPSSVRTFCMANSKSSLTLVITMTRLSRCLYCVATSSASITAS